MRTILQELEFQVMDIFNEFYKEKLENEKVTSFIINNKELDGMLDNKYDYETKGKFNHPQLDEIFYNILIKDNKRILIFVKLELGNGG